MDEVIEQFRILYNEEIFDSYRSASIVGTGVAQSVKWLDYELDDWDSIPSRRREEFLSSPRRSDPLWGPHSLLFNRYQDLSPGLQCPGREAGRSPPTSVKVKNAWSHTSTPSIGLYGEVLNEAMVLWRCTWLSTEKI